MAPLMPEHRSIVGSRIGVYEVESLIGAGGMGEVYRARDARLRRDVAIKILPRALTADADRLSRFEREARMLAALNHPNIATIHGLEVDERSTDDRPVYAIVMELVEGQTLAQTLAGSAHALSVGAAVSIAHQIADALGAAHEKGIVHRDLKPANIIITVDQRVKILDFGLAKPVGPEEGEGALTHAPTATFGGTRPGMVVGTAAYMSPEQAQSRPVDARADIFSFGVVLYEMLAGRPAFAGETVIETLARILETQPADLRTLRADIPSQLVALVEQCLEKDRDRRPSARDVQERLAAVSEPGAVTSATRARRRGLMPALAVAAVAVAVAGGWWATGRDARAARRRVPELMQLADRFDYDGFYRAARDVVPRLPDDLQIKQVWLNLTFPMEAIDSDPPGADVWVKGYSAVNAEWIPIGHTPLEDVRVPFGAVRVRVAKDGYAPFEGTPSGQGMKYALDPIGVVPEGMVRVRGSVTNVMQTSVSMPDYWMDRFEVTNRQFKDFVDAGGYQSQKYWNEPIVENGRQLPWEDAVARFRDRTGRPGPAAWELGTYPEGQADFPVSGVSWYEAAAYAAFAEKSLPTAFQWRGAAAGIGGFGGIFSDILTFSNFGLKGAAAVGTNAGLGPQGTFDMAGNVKEWCWNQSAGGRMILGGAWNEPSYRFLDLEAQPPLQRLPTYGFRLVKNIEPQSRDSYAELRPRTRDYTREQPVDDAAFEILRGLFRYDPRPLNDRVEDREETPDWHRERVTLDAAYDGERLIAHVFLPKSASPPYQTIVYFPGGDAPNLRSSRDLRLTAVDFLIRSGRALVFPVYKGTFERRVEATGINAARDVAISSVKDFGRVLDLIDSRPDLDRERIGFYGDSRGTFYGVVFGALEPRLKASVLLGGGLPTFPLPAEIDLLNFAPRVRVPTLMVSGRGDFLQPLETAQLPLFRLLGVRAQDKRHALFNGGHFPDQLHDVMREMLDWFDRYLGPISRN